MNTRFNYDTARTQKRLEESTYAIRYHLDTPGAGINLPFQDDPQIRMQKYGANMMTNTVGLENELRGMTRPINKNALDMPHPMSESMKSKPVSFPSANPFVEESRATHPAFMYRDLQRDNWSYLPMNPQKRIGEYTQGSFGLERNFQENIQTRILEKDSFLTFNTDRYAISLEEQTEKQKSAFLYANPIIPTSVTMNK